LSSETGIWGVLKFKEYMIIPIPKNKESDNNIISFLFLIKLKIELENIFFGKLLEDLLVVTVSPHEGHLFMKEGNLLKQFLQFRYSGIIKLSKKSIYYA
jgi:hypothetical protein